MLSTSTTQVFIDHNPAIPLPPQDSNSTRFVCLSDTHSRKFDVPLGDVLLHAGDLSSWGHIPELKKTIEWLASLPHPVKIIIAGNHDHCLDEELGFIPNTEAARNIVCGPQAQAAGICYLEYECIVITTPSGHRWKVYGSPAAPRYASGAFQYESGIEAREIYQRIPVDTDILLTHTPPFDVHDLTRRGKNAGCTALAERLAQLDQGSMTDSGLVPPWKCRLHVWGHIHEAYGASIKKLPQSRERVQINAAVAYDHFPIVVDLPF